MSLRKYLNALGWEFLQNLPMILGFIAAARLRSQDFWLALLVLVAGIGLGIATMHYTEPKLHQEKYAVSWKGDFITLGLFMIMALPFLFYFSIENGWLNWKTDLVLGAVLGIVLTLGQTLGWTGEKRRMVLHGLAMAASFPIIMVSLRLLLKVELWELMLSLTVLVTLGASAVITLIDYGEMYRTPRKTALVE